MRREADIEAEVRFLTTLEGGRNSAVSSNYRPDHKMGETGMLNGAQRFFPDLEWVQLGATVRSLMIFTVPEYQFGKPSEGLEFTIQEGNKIVGTGRVAKVLNAAMRAE